ncbi:MAG: hypothetical protein IH586_06275, partial [Anaerolineaceae bacterium]|nr:hypothetical protein [Anaerolineaceae bacterium]
EMPHPYPPEQVVPFSVSGPAMEGNIRSFSKGIPYAPDDLNSNDLRARLVPVYLPLWLVDAQIDATWNAEAGFDYEVISHQESFHQDSGRWQTREVKEARVRWENRVGRIHRAYQNVIAPALDDAVQIEHKLGEYHTEKALPYQPGLIARTFVRLPDHTPQEAWGEATAAFQKASAEDCQAACAAGHLRQFAWKAQLSQINWTLMLLPAYSSYYLDDQGKPQSILIHGQTGQIYGTRRASLRKASSTSLGLFLLGIILFLVGLILDSFSAANPWLGGISPLLILVGIGSAVAAFFPYLAAWDFNRKQS